MQVEQGVLAVAV